MSLVAVVGTHGCAFRPHTVTLHPTLSLSPMEAAQGRPVLVRIRELRGGAATALQAGLQPWPLDADSANGLRTSIESALRAIGFSIVSDEASAAAPLEIEIRQLGYRIQNGFWAATLHSECSSKATCAQGQPNVYEQLYRGTHTQALLPLRGQGADEADANSALREAMRAMLTDPSLLSCLIESSPN